MPLIADYPPAPATASNPPPPPPLPVPTVPEYYQVDESRVSYAAWWRILRSWRVIFAWIAKLVGNPIASTVGVRGPHPLREIIVAPHELPAALAGPLEQMRRECEALGFESPIYFQPRHLLLVLQAGYCLLRQSSGETVALLLYCRSMSVPRVREPSVTFYTALRDGRLLITINRNQRFDSPPGDDDIKRLPGQSQATTYREHLRRLEAHRAAGCPPVPAAEFEEAARIVERYDRRVHEFHVNRGLYQRMTPEEVVLAQAHWEASESAAAGLPESAGEEVRAVFESLRKHEAKAGKVSVNASVRALVVLALSILAFAIYSGTRWNWNTAALVTGVLLFHEMGHYLAMRAFGYRNMRMVFVPFMGAVIFTREPRVPGWQKAVVALAGPIPGLALGGGLLLAIQHGWVGGHAMLLVIVLLVLNGFNLLPLYPLDGGRVLDETIFRRSPFCRAAFLTLAGAGLLLVAWQMHVVALGIFGYLVLVGAVSSWRLARALWRLQAEGEALVEPFGAGEHRAGDIRPRGLARLLAILRSGQQMEQPAKRPLLVASAVNAVEQTRSRPPGPAATLALLGVYGAAVTLVVYFLLWPILAQYTPASRARREAQRHALMQRLERYRQAQLQAKKATDSPAENDGEESASDDNSGDQDHGD